MEERKPILIKRKAITMITENGSSYGGWAHFSKDLAGQKPTGIRLKKNQRILFCPYCGEWTIYQQLSDDQYTWKCTSWCGWSNTNDFYVKSENDLWGLKSSKSKSKKK